MIYLDEFHQNMPYAVRYQSFRKFGAGYSKRKSYKNWILRCFPELNTISLRDYQLILCMVEFLH